MGAWGFVRSRMSVLLAEDAELRAATRIESGSPASGSAPLHQLGQKDLINRAFAGL